MSSSLYGSQRNYHFQHNQLSTSNPFNMNSFNSYQQKQSSSLPQSNQPNANLINNSSTLNSNNSFGKNSLYSNPANKFLSNINPTRTMNFQERVIAYGQDKDENYFKRSLRKSPVSNAIQSTSYNIINNIPNTLPIPYGTMSGTGNVRFDNMYNQKRDHVADLLNYTTTKSNFGYNNNYQGVTSARNPQYMQNQNINNIRVVDSIDNIVSGFNNLDNTGTNANKNNKNNYNTINTPLSNPSRTPNKSEKASTPLNSLQSEKVSMDISEYYESPASAVKEYAYKEDSNSRFRDYMEDRGKAIDCFNNNPNDALFCLFDGHGGGEVSKYLQENFHKEFKTLLPTNNLESEIITLFDTIDQKIKNSNFFHVGSTACIVYITKENGQRILYCANIGDTRCTLVSAYQGKRLSYDDRASDTNEYNRITNSGGIVFAGRVYGQLMLSRAFGDWELKPYGVINVPHVLRMKIEDTDKYIVIASDGIWDVFQDDDIYRMSLQYNNAKDFCNNIIKDALLRGTMDNISCFVVKLN